MSFSDIHSKFVFPRRKRVLKDHLSTLLPASAKVLDVGCGDGSIAAGILSGRPDVTIRGIDVLIREQSAIPVTRFDGLTIPAEDDSEDAVMFVDVLHHTTDPMILLKEAVRVSRRWILIKDHFRDGFMANDTLRLMDWVGNAHFGVSLPYNYWSSAQWNQGFEQLGLRKSQEVLELGLYPFWANWIFGRNLHFVTLLEKRDGLGVYPPKAALSE